MIVVTGGAGFIGSNLVRELNARGYEDVVVVDNLRNGAKFHNIVNCAVADYISKEDFIDHLRAGGGSRVTAIFHLGACSTTTEWDGRYMMSNNFTYSKELLLLCQALRIPFIYASSAAVYGASGVFSEDTGHERPLNVYGYSKALFDEYVRRILPRATAQIVGLRYFNIYGPREQHKQDMASIAFHHFGQCRRERVVRLFEGCHGYGAGEQRRDFVHVADAVNVNLWFFEHPDVSGIFNVGTGRAQPFNDVAQAVIDHFGEGRIEYIPFPEHLEGRYQSFTQADIDGLRTVGYDVPFRDVRTGVREYMQWLSETS